MSRYDFGPEVRTFYEIDCEGCGWGTAVTDVDEVFDEVTRHHADDCPYPRRVTVARRREVPPGDPWHWEVVISDPFSAGLQTGPSRRSVHGQPEDPAPPRVDWGETEPGVFVGPPEPVYWPKDRGPYVVRPNVAGWRAYRELASANPLLGVTYITRTIQDRILYVGSGDWRRPFTRHHSNSRGATDATGYGLSTPEESRVIEVLAIARSRWLAKVLESVICEIIHPPLNAVGRILPPDRHLSERDAAIAFWNRNYASRFKVKAPWPYGWGESAQVSTPPSP